MLAPAGKNAALGIVILCSAGGTGPKGKCTRVGSNPSPCCPGNRGTMLAGRPGELRSACSLHFRLQSPADKSPLSSPLPKHIVSNVVPNPQLPSPLCRLQSPSAKSPLSSPLPSRSVSSVVSTTQPLSLQCCLQSRTLCLLHCPQFPALSLQRRLHSLMKNKWQTNKQVRDHIARRKWATNN